MHRHIGFCCQLCHVGLGKGNEDIVLVVKVCCICGCWCWSLFGWVGWEMAFGGMGGLSTGFLVWTQSRKWGGAIFRNIAVLRGFVIKEFILY